MKGRSTFPEFQWSGECPGTLPAPDQQDAIHRFLSGSRFLLVVITKSVFLDLPDGSPNWVVREIEYLTQLPQAGNVLAITLDGSRMGPFAGSSGSVFQDCM